MSQILLARPVGSIRQWIEKKREARRSLKRSASTGRAFGAPVGRWVTDLAELKQTIILCSMCDAGWRRSAPRYHYEFRKDWHEYWGGVIGRCDACREPGHSRKIYIHQSLHGKV